MDTEKQLIEMASNLEAEQAMNTLRVRVADLVETIGQAAGLMREAHNDTFDGYADNAKICADDAIQVFEEAREMVYEIINGLVAWKGGDQ